MKNATRLLDEFCRDGIAIEVTHRAKRRLFALANLAPLRDSIAAPRRPEPFRGRGRPPLSRRWMPPFVGQEPRSIACARVNHVIP